MRCRWGCDTKYGTHIFVRQTKALAPPGVELPAELIETGGVYLQAGVQQPATPEEITAAIQRLPEGTVALKADLLALMNQPDQWPFDYRVVAGYGANKRLLEMTRRACQVAAVRNRYALIRNANKTFREIADQNATGTFQPILVSTEIMIRKDKNGKGTVLYDPIYAALLGEDLDNIKSCLRCKKLFFAPRKNSVACEKCREAYRKQIQRSK